MNHTYQERVRAVERRVIASASYPNHGGTQGFKDQLTQTIQVDKNCSAVAHEGLSGGLRRPAKQQISTLHSGNDLDVKGFELDTGSNANCVFLSQRMLTSSQSGDGCSALYGRRDTTGNEESFGGLFHSEPERVDCEEASPRVNNCSHERTKHKWVRRRKGGPTLAENRVALA